MKEYTTTATIQGNESNTWLDGVNMLADQMEKIEKEKVESLAKFFDAYDYEIAKKIRDEGLPVYAFCGEKVYPTVKENMSYYLMVTKQPICEEYQIILSWVKEPNPFNSIHFELNKPSKKWLNT